ncbi:hypothetical protein M413DRAFT_445189 [Hebeloma cylindrosporum]|uniref:REJ domain-containing protein n=1 Tax=Hebeloma cylindrosporum TaxID=76867 RepID=A0A0C3CED5_HEBCY|nr:hypothetical protein M413DRAFT_445189 [Hebeloma cylindrosporum h7]
MKFTSFSYMTAVFLTLALTAVAQDTTTSDDSTFSIDPISSTDDFPLPSSTDTDVPTDVPTDISSTPVSSITPSITTSRILTSITPTTRPISSSTTPNAPSSTVSATKNGALPTMNSQADKMMVGMFAGLVAAVVL